MTLFSQISGASPAVKGIQPIFQNSMPPETGAGVCVGLTAEWLYRHSRLSSRDASKRFGREINENLGSIISQQQTWEARMVALVRANSSGGWNDSMREDLARLEAPGLRLKGSRTGALDSSNAIASANAISNHMQKDGFYRVVFKNGPEAHVIGAMISPRTGEFKLMDPNLGEFSASNSDSFGRLLAVVLDSHGYHEDYNEFRVSRFSN